MKYTKIIWLILFIIYTLYVLSEVFLFGNYVLNLRSEGFSPTIGEYVNELVIIIFLIGFFGFIRSKKIIHSNFWKVVFICAIVIEIYKLVLAIKEYGFNYFNLYIEVWWSPLLTLAVIPAFIAIYLYSFKSNKLWLGN